MRMIKGLILAAAAAVPLMSQAADEPVTNVTWKSSVSLGLTYKDGNTEKSLYTMNLKGDRFAPKSDWINSLYGEYGTTESAQTEGQLRGQSNYRYKFGSENFYGGIFAEGYHDAIKDIYVRVKIGPNIGYYFINSERTKLDGSIGINGVYEDTSQGEQEYAEWRVAGNYLYTISEGASCYVNAEYSTRIDDTDQGSGLLVVGAKSKLRERLSMFIEAREEYENNPAPGTEHTDTTIIAGLSYDIL